MSQRRYMTQAGMPKTVYRTVIEHSDGRMEYYGPYANKAPATRVQNWRLNEIMHEARKMISWTDREPEYTYDPDFEPPRGWLETAQTWAVLDAE